MKILQIPNYFYPNFGGIEQVARDISRVLSTQGVEQKMICFNSNASDGDYHCKASETVHEIVDGVEVVRCGVFAKIASQSLSLVYARELRKLLKEFCPDKVIFHYPNPFVAAILLRFLSRDAKLILYWDSDIVKQRLLGKLFHRQNLRLLDRAQFIVAASPNYMDGSQYLSQYKEKCLVIPNCVSECRTTVNSDIIERAARFREKYTGKTICFATGRHVSYKGFDKLAEASALLPDNYIVAVAGAEGPQTPLLHSYAEKDSKFLLLGRIPDAELKAWQIACDIFCFPSVSRNEAFGIALAEAMSFGKPAITFRIPGSGVNFVNLDGKTGIECPEIDPKIYASAIKQLSENLEQRLMLGMNAKKRAEDVFSYQSFAANIVSLLCD